MNGNLCGRRSRDADCYLLVLQAATYMAFARNTQPMNLICAIFDLDGTLVASEEHCNQAFLDLLPQLDETLESLVTLNRGKKLSAIFEGIERKLGVTLPSNFELRYRTHVDELFARKLQPNPGVKEMLDMVCTIKCVASSGPPAKIQRALELTGLEDHFRGRIFSSYDIGCWKPDPGLFLHVAQQMNVDPDRCAVIEDSEVGIRAACAAGMQPFHYMPSTNMAAHQCGVIGFTHMWQLPELLRQFAECFRTSASRLY